MALPHADAERISSDVTDVKTKKRNRLSESTLGSVCISRNALRSKNQSCVTFEVSEAYLKNVTGDIYLTNDPKNQTLES